MKAPLRGKRYVLLCWPVPLEPQVFSSDQVYEHFLPMALRYLTDTAAAVRPVAAEGLACFLRANKWVAGPTGGRWDALADQGPANRTNRGSGCWLVQAYACTLVSASTPYGCAGAERG